MAEHADIIALVRATRRRAEREATRAYAAALAREDKPPKKDKHVFVGSSSPRP